MMKTTTLLPNQTVGETINTPFFKGKNEPNPLVKPFIQAKLTVNEPGDEYEQEADAVADKVMRMPAPALISPSNPPDENKNKIQLKPIPFSQISRKCAHCQDEEKVQRKESKSGGRQTAPPIVNDVISSSGKSLDGGTRHFMESRIGHDFSNVQVHTDSRASESASSVNALAYTSGNHIVFNSGQYAPNTEGGKRLLAHELAHVGQQGGSNIKRALPLIPIAIGGGIIAGVAYAIWVYNCLTPCEIPMYRATYGNDYDGARSGGFRLWYFLRTGRPVPSNAWDAFGHCHIACCGTKRCGSTATYLAGRGREFWREYVDSQPHDSYSQDVNNQELGRQLGSNDSTNCETACQNEALPGGRMDLSAPTTYLWTPTAGRYAAPPPAPVTTAPPPATVPVTTAPPPAAVPITTAPPPTEIRDAGVPLPGGI